MKLWVDDIRPPTDVDWHWAMSSAEAIECLKNHKYTEVSFDHDLGGDDTTRPIVLWLCEHEDRWPDYCNVHSMNPIGRAWLIGMIERYHV